VETQQAIQLLKIANDKFDEFVGAANALLSESDLETTVAPDEPEDPTASSGQAAGTRAMWRLEGGLPDGSFQEVGRKSGQTYTWGDGTVDEYNDFIQFRGTDGFDGTQFALGLNTKGDVVGFFLGSGGGSKRGITYFFRADNYTASYEMLSMIRGGGATGKAGFGPADTLPDAYQGFKVDVLRDRIRGKWNVQAVVADRDDYGTMLRHTFLQARLRGLI
jgi:hypothetical protein